MSNMSPPPVRGSTAAAFFSFALAAAGAADDAPQDSPLTARVHGGDGVIVSVLDALEADPATLEADQAAMVAQRVDELPSLIEVGAFLEAWLSSATGTHVQLGVAAPPLLKAASVALTPSDAAAVDALRTRFEALTVI